MSHLSLVRDHLSEKSSARLSLRVSLLLLTSHTQSLFSGQKLSDDNIFDFTFLTDTSFFKRLTEWFEKRRRKRRVEGLLSTSCIARRGAELMVL